MVKNMTNVVTMINRIHDSHHYNSFNSKVDTEHDSRDRIDGGLFCYSLDECDRLDIDLESRTLILEFWNDLGKCIETNSYSFDDLERFMSICK